MLSVDQTKYLKDSNFIRFDGRQALDHRDFSVATHVLPHVNGSAHVKFTDAIDVLCSMKVCESVFFCVG